MSYEYGEPILFYRIVKHKKHGIGLWQIIFIPFRHQTFVGKLHFGLTRVKGGGGDSALNLLFEKSFIKNSRQVSYQIIYFFLQNSWRVYS